MMHVDNTLAIYTSTTKILKNLEVNTIIYKNGKIALLDMNLGYKIQHKAINIIECQTITSINYINAEKNTVEDGIKYKIQKLPTTIKLI